MFYKLTANFVILALINSNGESHHIVSLEFRAQTTGQAMCYYIWKKKQ